MQRKIKVEFYRVEVPPILRKDFEQILQNVNDIPVQDRTQTGHDAPIRLHQGYENGDFWEGEIVRIRMI